jgi:hypothetical protein
LGAGVNCRKLYNFISGVLKQLISIQFLSANINRKHFFAGSCSNIKSLFENFRESKDDSAAKNSESEDLPVTLEKTRFRISPER